ncbi:hypothetical protein WDW37_13115 [Bdellovibrionota bacterium FG-1]
MAIRSILPCSVFTAILTLFLTFFTTQSSAQLSDQDYRRALKIAEKKATRIKNRKKINESALTTSLVELLFGHPYQKGDNWMVAAWTFENPMARMTGDPSQLSLQTQQNGVFIYEVISASLHPAHEVKIRITQLESSEIKKPDPRVIALSLRMNNSMQQSEKTYLMEDRQGLRQWVPVSPEGLHSWITPLELFPLDVPELVTADSRTVQTLPRLPPSIQETALRFGFGPDLARSHWYEQDDFFGRPIQALWQQGDPWPAYYRTNNGIAILIKKGAP